MDRCPACGADLPSGARFCPFCGSSVAAGPAPTEERRVVTILFVDLVGFTERSDRADPEDVRRTLVPFHRTVKEDIERFGGTLDKFIGDAVMGVFGAPVAHEDDPVRAVRAGLATLRSVEDLRRGDPRLSVRVAVDTGEAVVSFGTGPQIGEAVAGDVVNTASRMQSLAPPDTVVIGEATLLALGARFDVEALPPATVKGKAEPLAVWRIVREREDVEPDRAPFVGRRVELDTLLRAFDEAAHDRRCRVVTLFGDAGVGKSRLVRELTDRLGGRARVLVGTCLPYGEGVTFAPVEQTVRDLAGVGASDGVATAVERVGALAARVETEPNERRWIAETLTAVLGISLGSDHGAVGADEVAQAWARALSSAEGPLVLVLEDLHLAAEALLGVVRTAVGLLEDRPVLVVATSRPEPDGRAPVEAGTALTLGALGEVETSELLDAVAQGRPVSETVRAAVLRRSGGNPLYAIEFARMARDRDMSAGELPTPGSVQAVIAARLDAIPADARSAALDASVLGDEIWADALAPLGERTPDEARAALAELERRGLVERRSSSLPTAEAHRFTHALIREVAYGRLPRGARARRHLAAGAWLEHETDERAEEWAESLARHFASAAELGAASAEGSVASAAREPALRWLIAAGDRAARVDPAAAFASFERALALAPVGSSRREDVLWRSANAGRRSGMLDADEVLARHLEALEIARARGDDVSVGAALTRAGTQLAVVGQAERARAALAEAVEVLERLTPGRPLARAYAYRAEDALFSGRTAEAIAFADRSLTLAGDLGDDIAIIALHIRGDARCSMGDVEGGLADLEDALTRAEDAGSAGDIVTSRNYLAEWSWATRGPAAGLAEWEMALELAERRNIASQAAYTRAGALGALLDGGDWDRALDWSAELLRLPAGRLDPAVQVVARAVRAQVLLARGRRDLAGDPNEILELAQRIDELHALVPALVVAAWFEVADGDVEGAAGRLLAFEAVTEGVAPEYRAVQLARVVRLCLAARRSDLAERLVGAADPRTQRDRLLHDAGRAMLLEARRDATAGEAYASVADGLRAFGDPFEEAMALLGHARLTAAAASRARARALLQRLGVPAER